MLHMVKTRSKGFIIDASHIKGSILEAVGESQLLLRVPPFNMGYFMEWAICRSIEDVFSINVLDIRHPNNYMLAYDVIKHKVHPTLTGLLTFEMMSQMPATVWVKLKSDDLYILTHETN